MMNNNEQPLTFGVFYKNTLTALKELDSTHSSLLEAESKSSELFNKLAEELTWPEFQVWIEPIDEKNVPTMTWCFDNTTLHF